MMVSLDSARQWYPREKLVACNTDHTQIAKLKRGENGIYPSVKFAIKQAMLSAGDLYNEAKSKQNEIMELGGSYLAERIPTGSLISPAGNRPSDFIETNKRSFTLNAKHDVSGEQEARHLSQPLDTAVLDWQRDVEEHNEANRQAPPSSVEQTEIGTKSDTNEKHFSRSQSQESRTSFGLGIEEPSMSSIPETLSSEPGGVGFRKELLSPEKLAGESVNDNTGPALVLQAESDHNAVSKSDPSAKVPSGQEQSNDKSKISADNVISVEDDELTKAIKEGNEEKIRALLNLHYAINRRSNCDHGATPLITATKHKQQNIVRFLLERGASTTARDNDGNTTLHFLATLTYSGHDSIEDKAYENIVELLLESQPPLEILNNEDQNPLMRAVRFGQKYLTEKLILSGAKVTASNSEDWTAVHFAVRFGCCPDLISILAEAGAALNARITETLDTPLHLASLSLQNSAEVIERLIAAGADKEATNQRRYTPLHLAIVNDQSACVAQLLKLGANVKAATSKKFTPLHVAAQYRKSSTDIVEHLLQAGADIEARSEAGSSPLLVAVFNDNITCVIHLLEHGANIQARDNRKWTALHFAAEYCKSSTDIVEHLLQAGADTEARTLGVASPLSIAVIHDNITCAIHLLERGANIQARDNWDYTSLHWAARKGLHPIVKLLLERGANPCATDGSTFGGRPSGMVGKRAYLDSSTKQEIKDTLKRAEKTWKASGKK